MALLVTQNQLKRKFKAEIKELKNAIQLQCADCQGFFIDPYQKCLDKNCPLYKFYPTAGRAYSPTLKKEICELAKRRGNSSEIVSRIKKSQPKKAERKA